MITIGKVELLARLLDREDPVHFKIVKLLFDSARPVDRQLADSPVRAESEMHAAVAGGCVTNGRAYLIPLVFSIFSGDLDLGTNRHAVTLGANKLQQYPVIVGLRDVVKQLEWTIQNRNHHIDSAVVVEVSEGNAAMGRL